MSIIVVEGPDGVGKSTVCKIMADMIERSGRETVRLRCPGGTTLGELLRGPLKDPSFGLSPFEKTTLFMAADENCHREAERISARGAVVVMDRCALSNYPYRMAQGEEDMAKLFHDVVMVPGRWKPKDAKVYCLDAFDGILRQRMAIGRNVAADRFDGLGALVAYEYRKLQAWTSLNSVKWFDTSFEDADSVAGYIASDALSFQGRMDHA